MPISTLPFDLHDGYVHDWLVAGPQTVALEQGADPAGVAQRYAGSDVGIDRAPVEPGPLDQSTFTIGDYEGLWLHRPCGEDHFVDVSALYRVPTFARAWATTQLVAPTARAVTLVATAQGPLDVWLNGAHVFRGEALGFHHDRFEVFLNEGANELMVRFDRAGVGPCAHQLALRVVGADEGLTVQLLTAIEDVALRNRLTAAFAAAVLDRDLYVWDEAFAVQWPDVVETSEEFVIRLQTPSGRIYAETKTAASAEDPSVLVAAFGAPQGELRLRFLPTRELFYDEDVRVQREIPVWGAGWQTYADAAYATPPERRVEALRHAIRCSGLYSDVARMLLGQWDLVDRAGLLRTIEAVERRELGHEVDLVGLLGMLQRWGDDESFPLEVREALEACLLAYTGWDEDDGGAQSPEILRYASEMLAGQRYPERAFADGQPGNRHRERAEARALSRLRRMGIEGFGVWDAGAEFEAVVVALSHMIDLSETEAIWQMASVLLDKVLITMALNSFRGVVGTSQGRIDITGLYGGPLAPTSGVTRLIWGQGLYNHHLAGLVSIACMEDYSLPPLIPEIATLPTEELWNRESHVTVGGEAVNKVAYRTPDAMLGSVQDHRKGEPGTSEHPWQATLGQRAVVYTSHPASMGRCEGHAPGFWLGNVTLPRVAQWQDTLFALYKLPDDDWMGFTHAYFPAFAFDEYVLRDSEQGQTWAFARSGDGYLALSASTGLTWMTRGAGAYRELRSYGRETVWCCQVGRAAVDGDFAAFQGQVLAQSLEVERLKVRLASFRGASLDFDWEGPLLRDGEVVPLGGFDHYDNAYCRMARGASEMEIRSENYLMRLDFGQDV